MFLISLTYKIPLRELDQYLEDHIAFLRKYYAAGKFIFSGPKVPRTGGLILAYNCSRGEAEAIIAEDPFYINQAADYELIAFDPSMCNEAFSHFIR
jgi:uncharacterized protein YciI